MPVPGRRTIDTRCRRRSNFRVPSSRCGFSMLRLCWIAVVLGCILLSGCGNVFVGAFSRPGSDQVVNGTVSIVQVTVIDGNVTVTAVTLVNVGSSNDLTFCGDQSSQFPVSHNVSATFTQGTPCASLVQVSAIDP